MSPPILSMKSNCDVGSSLGEDLWLTAVVCLVIIFLMTCCLFSLVLMKVIFLSVFCYIVQLLK